MEYNNKIQLHNGDCLEFMKTLEDNSIDLILTDPPYGTINGLYKNKNGENKTSWDNIINIEEMYKQCDRILRPNGCLILFSQEPFTSQLIIKSISNMPFSYRSIWLKDSAGNSLYAKKAPLNFYEDINVFFKSSYDTPFSNPLRLYAKDILNFTKLKSINLEKQFNNMSLRHFFTTGFQFSIPKESLYNEMTDFYKLHNMSNYLSYNKIKEINVKYKRIFNLPKNQKYKSNIYQYKKPYEGLHPTQKPVDLLEDLIKTYSNESMTVLDFTMGSGSTGIACLNTNRSFIGCELDDNYFKIAKNRIENHKK